MLLDGHSRLAALCVESCSESDYDSDELQPLSEDEDANEHEEENEDGDEKYSVETDHPPLSTVPISRMDIQQQLLDLSNGQVSEVVFTPATHRRYDADAVSKLRQWVTNNGWNGIVCCCYICAYHSTVEPNSNKEFPEK